MIKQLTFLILAFYALSTNAQQFAGKVINVIDGNTFEIIDEYEEVTKFMLSEADCPELGQELSEEARLFSEKLILKKKVKVEHKGKDWLGNKLVTITLKNGKVLHEELIKEGYGWASKKATTTSNNLQAEAKSNGIGIWSNEEPTPPWVYRRKQTMMTSKGR